MALRSDSYGTVNEVRALTRHLLDGQIQFNDSTRPTLTDVETIIDRVSGVLNAALAGEGFATPITNSTAVLACADWVVMQSAKQVELTQRGTGWNAGEGSRTAAFELAGTAAEWARGVAQAFVNMGISETNPMHQGLMFTALLKHSERTDPDSTTYEQPKFRRGQFDL